ncbi:S-adenosyl-L-methionine-dependent methyltransferase [Acephala macrosclerotiorum]|nr:S-adenosyl-L-methionine-dependent methyltransferase [Acephala macrosclerotiorum]
MTISMKTKGFSDTYPFDSLGEGLSSPDDVVLVDVGGGYGHALANIQQYVPELKGKKMVLEDFAKTIESHVPLENTAAVPYNFLTTEQPIKGARAYLLRHVLHDWSDHVCRKILLHTIPAMTKESRILIAEIILPDLNPPILGALADIVLMKYGGSGRKRREWIAIFESAGLEVVKIWPAVTIDSIMELRLKSS